MRTSLRVLLGCIGVVLLVSPASAWWCRHHITVVVGGGVVSPGGMAAMSYAPMSYAPMSYAPMSSYGGGCQGGAAAGYYPSYAPNYGGGCQGGAAGYNPSYASSYGGGCCGSQGGPGASPPSALPPPKKDKTESRLRQLDRRLDDMLATLKSGTLPSEGIAANIARDKPVTGAEDDPDGLMALTRQWRELGQQVTKSEPGSSPVQTRTTNPVLDSTPAQRPARAGVADRLPLPRSRPTADSMAPDSSSRRLAQKP
jgi:hypothetical protein